MESSVFSELTIPFVSRIENVWCLHEYRISGPKVIKLFPSSAQLRLKFIPLINVKMPTIVGFLTFISRINYRLCTCSSRSLVHFGIHEQFKF